ncbi:hypothetical protein [Asticcacaulis benevestitus]|uniref:Uncharacterized protein n=1 Tax=Asticcacaulis benevestitus DSM 16100 = ATCC BAA-896 TaxID=1121022 RepID=V4Q3U2_9CAUL|nr:hypothetical protein [Asticcacaulis benevestitus]ESQ92520.1 hypothetical protein ABENE_07745 [Asticcacaulis benevestitus DSM 16100 = ATCC BAA-896]
MNLKYQPEDMVIVQDDPDYPIVASLTMAKLEGMTAHILGKVMAAAPLLVCVLDGLMDLEPDDEGYRTLSKERMVPIRHALSAFTLADLVALIHYTHIVK